MSSVRYWLFVVIVQKISWQKGYDLNDLNVTIPDLNQVISYAMETHVVLSKTMNLFDLIKQVRFLLLF